MSKAKEKNNPKKTMSKLRIICIVAIIISAIIIMGYSVDEEYKLINAHTQQNITELYDELMPQTDIVEFDELMIVDKYATYGSKTDENRVEQAYYLAVFKNSADGEEKPYYISLGCDTDSEEYETIEKYINNDEQQVGDFIIPVCATYCSADRNGEKFYQDYMAEFNKAVGVDIADSNLRLAFAFDVPSKLDEYESSQKSEGTAVQIGAAIFALLSLAGVIVTTVKIKKLKKEEISNPQLPQEQYYQSPEEK